MNRFEWREMTEIGPRGGFKFVGVIWDRDSERVRVNNISKYAGKVWLRDNQEELMSYEETTNGNKYM